MLWLWYTDRITGAASYFLLVAAALTGIPYNHPPMGIVHRFARKIHTPLSTVAVIVLLGHSALGAYDAWLVETGDVPAPKYGLRFLAAGTALGLGATVLTIVATLAFADPKRFQRSWQPRTVHLFAYGGFAFATLHALAIGTDVAAWGLWVAVAIGVAVAALIAARIIRPTQAEFDALR